MKVLVLNAGSSSVKYELFDLASDLSIAHGSIERIAEGGPMPDHAAAIRAIVDELREVGLLKDPSELLGVGHRVVHGGERFRASVVVDEDVKAGIREHARLAPLHNPANLVGIEMAEAALPGVPQVAVFDTAFHHSLPRRAWLYALPHEVYEKHGVRRYGFHGISHSYVAKAAARHLGRAAEETNLIVLHLGNGASATAVQGGRSIDTSMGLTPLEGLVMGTRPGDLDPGIVSYLQDEAGMSRGEIVRMLNDRSGLLGLCGSNDMRDVSRRAAEGDDRAEAALEVYTYRVRKYVGAYLATLGRVDAICFTAGIGENQAEIRRRSLAGLGPLGIELDDAKNEKGVVGGNGIAEIQAERSRVRILVVPTDEEREIASEVRALLG